MRFKEIIDERLIMPNNGKQYGQVIIMGGGAGSGKNFAVQKFINSSQYQQFDIDELKKSIAKIKNQNMARFKAILDKLELSFPGIVKIDLSNPEHSTILHKFVDSSGINRNKRATLYKAIQDSQEHLPNIILNTTFSYEPAVISWLHDLANAGYKPEDIHIVWVMTSVSHALRNNDSRAKKDKKIDPDYVRQNHKDVADVMRGILMGHSKVLNPHLFNGDIYVINNLPEKVQWHEPKDYTRLDQFDKDEGRWKERKTVQSFESARVKRSGHPIDKKEVQKVDQWMKQNLGAGLGG